MSVDPRRIPVRLTNYTAQRYRGPLRRVVDVMPPHPSGEVDGVRYVVGKKAGECGWCIDLFVDLQPGEAKTVDLARPAPWTAPEWEEPRYSLVQFAGRPMGPGEDKWAVEDGAGVHANLFTRVTPMLSARLLVHRYPGVPWAVGEIVIAASDPSVPDVTAVVPENFRLEVGGALVIVPGLAPGAPLLPAGTRLGDGQACAFPVLIAWPDEFSEDGVDLQSAAAAMSLGVCGVARTSLGPIGAAEAPPAFSALAWSRQFFGGAIARLHSFTQGPLGVTANSGNSGDQEDQGGVPAGEALHPQGVGAEVVRYLTALDMAHRPCHHLRADGSQWDPAEHPSLVLWDGRPHATSPDQLGKGRALVPHLDSWGWWGPDASHWLMNTLAEAYELTGSPALQWLLSAQARIYLGQRTVRAGLATSSPGEPRAVGWEGIGVVGLWRCLEDRALAQRVRERFEERVRRIIVPAFTKATTVKAWAVSSDPRIVNDIGGGFTLGFQVWQQAVGAFGLDLACETFGLDRRCAFEGALTIVEHCYSRDGATWTEWDSVGWNWDGSPLRADQYVQKGGVYRTGWFRHAWTPLAVCCVLRNDPTHARARSIYEQLRGEAMRGNRPLDWFCKVPSVPAADVVEGVK